MLGGWHDSVITACAFWVKLGIMGLIDKMYFPYFKSCTYSYFGAFGLLSFGLMYLVLRYLVGDRAAWSERWGCGHFGCITLA